MQILQIIITFFSESVPSWGAMLSACPLCPCVYSGLSLPSAAFFKLNMIDHRTRVTKKIPRLLLLKSMIDNTWHCAPGVAFSLSLSQLYAHHSLTLIEDDSLAICPDWVTTYLPNWVRRMTVSNKRLLVEQHSLWHDYNQPHEEGKS